MEEIDSLNKIKFTIDNLQKIYSSADTHILEHENEVKELEDKLQFIVEARQFYKKAIDIAYERSIKELKDVINSALSFIFSDRDFEVDIIVSDKRGKSLSMQITDEGKPVNLRRAMGMGIKCVVSAILHIYYLQCKDSPILILDEAYSAISDEYVGNFFGFLQQLCESLNFRIILITHDVRFKQYGTKTYTISKGKILDE